MTYVPQRANISRMCYRRRSDHDPPCAADGSLRRAELLIGRDKQTDCPCLHMKAAPSSGGSPPPILTVSAYRRTSTVATSDQAQRCRGGVVWLKNRHRTATRGGGAAVADRFNQARAAIRRDD